MHTVDIYYKDLLTANCEQNKLIRKKFYQTDREKECHISEFWNSHHSHWKWEGIVFTAKILEFRYYKKNIPLQQDPRLISKLVLSLHLVIEEQCFSVTERQQYCQTFTNVDQNHRQTMPPETFCHFAAVVFSRVWFLLRGSLIKVLQVALVNLRGNSTSRAGQM